MQNMLNCAEQVQIQKYKTHKTLKSAGVQAIILKHLTKQSTTTTTTTKRKKKKT